jgi:flavin-binding protein dodecin
MGEKSHIHGGTVMPDKTYKLIELVGVSATSMEDAIQNAIARANQTLKNLDWFEVVEARGLIQDGKVSQFQVKLKVGFRRTLSPCDERRRGG